MLDKNTKVMVRSPDGDIDFFDIASEILQGDNLERLYVNNLPRLRTSNVNRPNTRKDYHIKKDEKLMIPSTMTHYADNTNDLARIANTPA